MAALLLDLPPEPTAQDEHQIRITLRAIAAQVELEQIQAQFGQEEDIITYQHSTASSSGLNSLLGHTRLGIHTNNSSAGYLTDSTSLLSEVEQALEDWRINDEQWEQSRFGSEPSEASDDGLAGTNSPPHSPSHEPSPPPAPSRRSDDPFDFLVSMFPRVPSALLGNKLASGQDLEAILDELMTEEFIAQDGDIATTPKKPTAQVKKKQPRKGPKDAFVVSLTDVLHRAPSPNLNHRKDTAAAGPGSSHASAWANAPSASNHWAAADSRSGHLASLTHVTTARVTSLLHVNNNSPARALAALLNQLRVERPRPGGPDSQLDQLRLIMPGLSTERYQLLLSATEDDISDAMDLQTFIGQTEYDGGAPLAKAELIADVQLGKSVQVHQKPTGSGNALHDHSSRSAIVPTVVLPSAMIGVAPRGHDFNPEAYSSAECAAFASEYLTKRNEAFRTAARQFQRGNNAHERGIAFAYAERGREHDARKRTWEARAARALVRERRVHDVSTIDLHSLTVHHALSQVRDSCNTWWSSSPSGTPAMPLRIVTGAGNHSKGHAVLLPAVCKLLDREGWRWKYDHRTNSAMSGPGAVLVTGAVARR